MATFFRLFDAGRTFIDGNGNPIVNGQLFVFEAGTTTERATFQDNGGLISHSSPIILNSSGQISDGTNVWVTTGDSKIQLLTSVVNGGAQVPGYPEDDFTAIGDSETADATEWTTFAGTPTFISTTSFSLTGNQTTIFHVGRRLQLTDSSTLYARILTSVFSTVTTITVVLDSGSLTSSLSAVSYGLISSENTSSPAILTVSTQVFTSSGTYTPPTNLKFAIVELVGGGGGGGGSSATANRGGGGGAGGGYSRELLAASAISTTETVTIGAGGTFGAISGGGGTGGTTSLGSLLSATGGAGGAQGTSSSGAIGGIGSGGDINIRGQGGGPSTTTEAVGGIGGSSVLGGGAAAPGGGDTTGNAGGVYGGGGGGGITTDTSGSVGGAGADGLIIVTEFS